MCVYVYSECYSLPGRLASVGIMGDQLRVPQKALEYHCNMVLGGLTGPLKLLKYNRGMASTG